MNEAQKTVLYCRVSSKEQAEEGYSLEAQESLLKDYAQKKQLQIAKTFKISESASGKQIRKTFHEMVKYTEQNKINTILCEKTDRLTRNAKDAVEINDWIEANPERQVHLVKESVILNKESKAHEKFIWDIKVATASYFTNNLSEEVRKGYSEKIKQGWMPYRAPLGYRTIGEQGHKTHMVDEATAPLVKMIFELYSSGLYSVPDLSELMYEKGLRSNISGRKVAPNGIYVILKNSFYYGEIPWGGKRYPGKHQPIILKELFEAVQKVLKTGRPDKYVKHNPLFKGLAHCGNCNHKISWYEKKSHWYGRCAHYKSCEQGKSPIREDRLVDQIFPFFEDLWISPQDIETIKNNLKQDHEGEIQTRQTQENDIARKLAINNSRLDMLYQDRLDNRISTGQYDTLKLNIETDTESLIKARTQLQTNTMDYFDFGINLMELAGKMKDLFPYATKEEKQEIFTLAFEQMKVTDKTLSIKYTPWFAKLREHAPDLKQICEPVQSPMDKRKNTNLVVDVHSWLGRQGSNLRHGDYINPKITSRDGLYHDPHGSEALRPVKVYSLSG